jgi:hypothetical protein
MPRKKAVPRPPKPPPSPSDKQAKQIERAYVKRIREPRLKAMRVKTRRAVEKQIQAEIKLFDRKDVLTKSYPSGHHVIICEGDSWFNHPFLVDLPDHLRNFGYSVLHGNRPGKRLRESLDEGLFLAPFKDARRTQIKALLLSGGGNDLINWCRGDAAFSPIFRRVNSNVPADYIDAGKLQLALKDLTGWITGIAKKLKATGGKNVAALLHCYEYVIPKKYGPSPFKGEWIDPQLDAVGAPTSGDFRSRITAHLQDAWIAAYKAVCALLGWEFVKTQGLVKGRWHDEIHPSSMGMYSVACEYWNVLHRLGIRPSRSVPKTSKRRRK